MPKSPTSRSRRPRSNTDDIHHRPLRSVADLECGLRNPRRATQRIFVGIATEFDDDFFRLRKCDCAHTSIAARVHQVRRKRSRELTLNEDERLEFVRPAHTVQTVGADYDSRVATPFGSGHEPTRSRDCLFFRAVRRVVRRLAIRVSRIPILLRLDGQSPARFIPPL